jgi:hypothetical protein
MKPYINLGFFDIKQIGFEKKIKVTAMDSF